MAAACRIGWNRGRRIGCPFLYLSAQKEGFGIKAKHQAWDYKITSGCAGVVLSTGMFALFGGLAFWLYQSENDAFVFGAMLAALMFIVLMFAIFRALCFQVCIGKETFFYQTKPGNGKCYRYPDIKQAWQSSGKNLNGTSAQYCNLRTREGEILKIPFFPADQEAIDALIQHVQGSGAHHDGEAEDKREYTIHGRRNGKTAIFFALFLLFMCVAINASLSVYGMGYAWRSPIVLLSVTVVLLILRYVSFRVKIGVLEVMVQTNPFNRKTYTYKQIDRYEEIEKVYRHRGRGSRSPQTLYYYFFAFTDKQGKTTKFQFEKPLYEYEIHVLKARIDKANGMDAGGIRRARIYGQSRM